MEEQIKRLTSIELPTLELEGHHRALKQALLQKVVENNQRKISFLTKFTGRISEITYGLSAGVISHRRAAKVTLISGLLVATAALLLFTIVKPAFLAGPSDMVLAEKIIKDSSKISAALGGADIASISFLTIKNNQAEAIITGTTGKSIQADIDLKNETVSTSMTFVQDNGQGFDITIGGLAPLLYADRETSINAEDKAKAINIARTDPLSLMLFSTDAVITGVYPAQLRALYFTTGSDSQTHMFPDATTVEPGPDGTFVKFAPAVVEITTGQDIQSVVVDLNTGKVIAITPGELPDSSTNATPALTR
jgi:hypothetical protein